MKFIWFRMAWDPHFKSFFMVKYNEKDWEPIKFHRFFMVQYNEKDKNPLNFTSFSCQFKNLHLSMKIHTTFICSWHILEYDILHGNFIPNIFHDILHEVHMIDIIWNVNVS